MEQLDAGLTEASPVRSEQRLLRLRHPVKTLLVGADGGGQLLLPDSVGRADVLQHPVDEFPQPPPLWGDFPSAESIDVVLKGQHGDRGGTVKVRVTSVLHRLHPKTCDFSLIILTKIYIRTNTG